MSFWVIIDPEITKLEIFVAMWNLDRTCSRLAQAEIRPYHMQNGTDRPAVAIQLSTPYVETKTGTIHDLIKELFRVHNINPDFDFMEIANHDGTTTIIIK